jgi:hypothetical protein
LKTSQNGYGAGRGSKEPNKPVFKELYPSNNWTESLTIDESKYRAMGPFEGWQYIMERMEL